jgi:hypothetical protein
MPVPDRRVVAAIFTVTNPQLARCTLVLYGKADIVIRTTGTSVQDDGRRRVPEGGLRVSGRFFNDDAATVSSSWEMLRDTESGRPMERVCAAR